MSFRHLVAPNGTIVSPVKTIRRPKIIINCTKPHAVLEALLFLSVWWFSERRRQNRSVARSCSDSQGSHRKAVVVVVALYVELEWFWCVAVTVGMRTEEQLKDAMEAIKDEMNGCWLNLRKAQQVFARKGSKRVHLIEQEHAENVFIVGCANDLGQMIPPIFLFKGKRKKIEWIDNLSPGSQIEMTKKGSMTTATFITWLDHFARFMLPENVLFIFDGASSHLDANIVDAADSHGVTLFCLPS
ncbi:hypothetical protein ILUMI_03498 [Ignelater luminosus]|uniref:DDE-1 domain-containing protein n=1 Tax=Ignelater luminosus TaxID=2038154 RepID=A0A8K0GJV9_IGNLU|nr:hypothetical protein ILUMI_03498 [Ignelater luminosus]